MFIRSLHKALVACDMYFVLRDPLESRVSQSRCYGTINYGKAGKLYILTSFWGRVFFHVMVFGYKLMIHVRIEIISWWTLISGKLTWWPRKHGEWLGGPFVDGTVTLLHQMPCNPPSAHQIAVSPCGNPPNPHTPSVPYMPIVANISMKG